MVPYESGLNNECNTGRSLPARGRSLLHESFDIDVLPVIEHFKSDNQLIIF